jgi:hypothetical protein
VLFDRPSPVRQASYSRVRASLRVRTRTVLGRGCHLYAASVEPVTIWFRKMPQGLTPPGQPKAASLRGRVRLSPAVMSNVAAV